jgi:hypothetical protein
MIEFKDKKIYFSGRGEKIEKDELIKYFLQNEGVITESLDEADMIIEGYMTPVHHQEQFYLLSKNGIEVVDIEKLEKQFSENIDIDSILMAVKISKEKQRVIKLLNNRYFSDDIFLSLLKYYDWGGEGLHDNDDNRDVSTAIVQRFCSLQQTNHNIQHSPIGIYYTALESTQPKLLEAVYNMPDYSISDKNALSTQPLSLKEVVALNPNTPKTVLMQILKDNVPKQLEFLALNESINKMISSRLFKLNNRELINNLISSGNLQTQDLKEVLDDENLKINVLRNFPLDDKLFEMLMGYSLSDPHLAYLSSNTSLTQEHIEKLFEFNIDNVNINLLRNPLCKRSRLEEFFKKNDLVYNIAIAHNPSLDGILFEKLFETGDINTDLALAQNKNTPKQIIKKLYQKNLHEINLCLASNEASPINILMQLQVDSRYNSAVSNNETYKEFSRNSLGIIQDENNRFKRDTYGDFWD